MRTLPPYAELLKLRVDEGEQGPLVVMPFHENVIGRPGYLHGGAIAGLLEFAAFTTLWRELDNDDVIVKPITVTVDYMRGADDHETFASATIERLGARIANVEAFAWQKDRANPVASARLNFLLERPDQ